MTLHLTTHMSPQTRLRSAADWNEADWNDAAWNNSGWSKPGWSNRLYVASLVLALVLFGLAGLPRSQAGAGSEQPVSVQPKQKRPLQPVDDLFLAFQDLALVLPDGRTGALLE